MAEIPGENLGQAFRRSSVHRRHLRVDTLVSSFGAISLDRDNNFLFPGSQESVANTGFRRFSRIAADISQQGKLISGHSFNEEAHIEVKTSTGLQYDNLELEFEQADLKHEDEQGSNMMNMLGSFGGMQLGTGGPKSPGLRPIMFRPAEGSETLMLNTTEEEEEEQKNLSGLFDSSPVFQVPSFTSQLLSMTKFGRFSLEQAPTDEPLIPEKFNQENGLPSDLSGFYRTGVTGATPSFKFAQEEEVPQDCQPQQEDSLFSTRMKFHVPKIESRDPSAPITRGMQKRTKDQAKYPRGSLSRAQQTLNASKDVSMAASLEHAPFLKLRRRNIDRRPEGRHMNCSTSSQSHTLSFNRSAGNLDGLTSEFSALKQEGSLFSDLDDNDKRGWIGSYCPSSRKVLLERYLQKRKQRVWNKQIRYAVRKKFADSRLRVKGRFVGKEDEAVLRDALMVLMI